jgi:hypothetical protein
VYKKVASEVDVNAAVSRTNYRLFMVLSDLGQLDEATKCKEEAANLRKKLTGIDPQESDNLEAFEKLVPYWGQ